SGDPFKAFHPRWSELTAKDDLLAGAFTAADGRRWRGMAQDHLMRQRIDLVVETAGRNRPDLDDLAARAVTNGYRVELVVLAAPAALSRASVLDRFEQMRRLYGTGRMVTPAMHDSSFLGIRDGLQRLDTGDFHTDAVHLIRRGGLIAYSHNEPGAATPGRGRAAAALETERGCWTESEAQDFEAAMARLAESQQQAVTEQLPELRALAQNLRLKPKRKVQTARIAGTTFTGLPASRHQPAPPPSTPRPGPGRGR
ncbi:MAG TPA: zeta toxin family protein, partial [Kineosporiaceae bacterium]|nr:zeta toxin family protein [Kineosporiaceae bacterium]